MKYGKWTVLKRRGNRSLCRCDCGTMRDVLNWNLKSGASTQCWACGRKQISTHGMERSPEYRIWVDIRRRCKNPSRPDYPRYGGRGVTVSDEWDRSFSAFFADMGPRPTLDHSIERVDNDGPYAKENCVWATRRVQSRNTRQNRIVVWGGREMPLIEAIETSGFSKNTVINRLNVLGWPLERALTEPRHYRGTPRQRRNQPSGNCSAKR